MDCTCLICQGDAADGIQILQKHICSTCEQGLVLAIEPHDGNIIHAMKQIWMQQPLDQ